MIVQSFLCHCIPFKYTPNKFNKTRMLLKYLTWLFPDVAECFFSVSRNEEGQFRWPGLGPAVWCLLLEAMCFLIALSLLAFWTLGYGSLLMLGVFRETAIARLPPATGPKRGELFPVTKLDASKNQVTPSIIQGFISRSEPVIIHNLPKKTFSSLAPGGQHSPSPTEAMVKSGQVIGATYLFPRALGVFGQWIQRNIQRPVLYMVRLSGSYGGTPAHMDGICDQVYYVARGRKRVWICPRQYHHLLDFQSGYNSVFIPGSDRESSDPFKWIKSVPGVWSFEVSARDVLIFNNAGCVHKFANVTEDPEIFSLRIFSRDLSPVTARHHVCNWEEARFWAARSMTLGKIVQSESGIRAVNKTY